MERAAPLTNGQYYIVCPSASNLAITFVAPDKPAILTTFEDGNLKQRVRILVHSAMHQVT